MKKQNLILNSFVLIFFLFFSFSNADELKYISGEATVTDGDTIKINDERIRFGGIDAPEKNFFGRKQFCYLEDIEVLCGKLSTEKLKEKIGNSFVNCVIEKERDNYKRHVGECYINNESLSVYMVRNGYAFDWPYYSEGKFANDQEYAKMNSLGFWNMKFEYPWIWKKKVREKK